MAVAAVIGRGGHMTDDSGARTDGLAARRIKRSAAFAVLVAVACLVAFRARIPGLRPDQTALVVKLVNPNVSDRECIFELWLYDDHNAAYEYAESDGIRRRTSFLSRAAYGRRDDVVAWLLNKGADPNPPGEPPLRAAIDRNDWALAAKLIDAGARWATELDSGETVREWAVTNYPKGVDQVDRLTHAPPGKR
jgi:hypothetical protein